MPPRLTQFLRTPRPSSTLVQPQLCTITRTFHTTRPLCLKEDADRHPSEIEQKKQEQIEKQKRGEGHWHEELASSGESNVKADREEVQDHDEHIEELQAQTERKGQKGQL